jgi:DNA ligase D-like protein (predicted ligase)
MPEWVEPMLATLTDRPFSDPAWIFETKLDGQRSLLFRHVDEIRLMTRNRKDRTSHYPDLEQAARRGIGADLIADGEIVAFDGARTSFSRLQGRMQNARPSAALVAKQPVIYYLFDLVWLDGRDLRSLPLGDRKDLLREAIAFDDPIRYSDHLEEDGELGLRAACEQGLEGLIAKRAASTYVAGRSREWLKLKCVLEQELVVGGYTDPTGSRTDFGALLVGYYEGGKLRYAGKVGTGYTAARLAELGAMLRKLETASSPFADARSIPRGAHWVRPKVVAQIGFAEWTTQGLLRQARFLGLRDDKAPDDVVRERAAPS